MYLSSGLSFCRTRRTSCTMDDVETNPGPDRIVSEKELIKLSKPIEPSYYKEVDDNLEIPRTGAPTTMPGSQTRPLSPDQIERCAEDFKFKYRTTVCKIRSDPLNPDSIAPFEDIYTNLFLEEEYQKNCKRPLEYSDLFDLKVNGEFPKWIMVQGEAGAGKTTFCAKIAWDWINNSPLVPKFVWVLVVPFREAKQYTIGEIAKLYLSKDNPTTACQITEYIRSNPKDVFIAFDGLDEFDGKVVQQRNAGSKSECHQPKSADHTKARSESKMNKNKLKKLMQPKSSSPTSATSQPRVNSAEASGSSSERGGIALRDILCSDELQACPVLVTSRPWKVTEIRWDIRLRNLYTFMHVEGFSKENVEVYIHKYFDDDVATADQLIQLTKDNNIISENMASYPIYIAMLCLMWRELEDEKREKFKSFQTFSQIFDEMFEFLRVHHAQKMITDLDNPSFKAYIAQIEKLMEPVAKVAFIGLQEHAFFFEEDHFEQCSDSMDTACRVGVLSQEKKLTSICDKSSPYLQSTIFFPHKLFQEYMAGVHLASLYELDHNEFNRLLEQVVLPRKEEFRYLLYFTVSRDKTIANHVMKCMVQGNTQNEEDRDFLVDVSFESQNLDTAALVRGGVQSLYINSAMKAHTVAGFVFTGIHLDGISLTVSNRKCGPTISHDLAEIMCSSPSLKSVLLEKAALHSDFYVVLAKEGNKSKVQTVVLEDVRCPTSASSHHLADALCSMPNLTDVTLDGEEFQEEFYSTLNAKASTLQVINLELKNVRCPTSASSHHLVDALCSMPKLTELELTNPDFKEEFFSTLSAKTSTLQVQTLGLWGVNCPTSASSHRLADALCSMPNLTKLKKGGMKFKEEFFSTLSAKASTSQVKTLELVHVKFPTSASSQQLVDALCSMPKLTDLTLSGKEFKEEFFSTLNAKASTLQVQTLRLEGVNCPTLASSHHLVNALCSMPKLTDLTVSGKEFKEEFFSTLHEKASNLKVKTLKLLHVGFPTSAATHYLIDALCFMPNPTHLTLSGNEFNEEFYSTLNAQASTLQFNTVVLEDLSCPTSASSHHLAEALSYIPTLTGLILDGEEFQEDFYSTLNANALNLQCHTLCLERVQFPTATSSRNLAESLCSMPNLTDLTFDCMDFVDEFCSTLKEKASSIQDSFPQVRKGNFTFNEIPQPDFDSLLRSLTDCGWEDACD